MRDASRAFPSFLPFFSSLSAHAPVLFVLTLIVWVLPIDCRFVVCVCMFECCVNDGRLIGFVPFVFVFGGVVVVVLWNSFVFVIEYHWYCDEAKIIRPSFELFDQWSVSNFSWCNFKHVGAISTWLWCNFKQFQTCCWFKFQHQRGCLLEGSCLLCKQI